MSFLHAMLLPKLPPPMHLHNTLSTVMVMPYSTAFDQRTHFTANEVRQWTKAHRIHWCHYIFHHPERAGMIEQWNRALKTKLQCKLSGKKNSPKLCSMFCGKFKLKVMNLDI